MAAASAARWVRAWSITGTVAAKPQGSDLRSHRIETYREIILSAIEAAGIRLAIEATGASLRDLPPYSPDFNPIENAFSKLKAILRSRHPCSN